MVPPGTHTVDDFPRALALAADMSSDRREYRRNDWIISTNKAPILDAERIDKTEAELQIPLPEMIFGDNHVTLHHVPTNWTFTVDAISALGLVDKHDAHLKVAHADSWHQKRHKHINGYDLTRVHRPFDWTYSTTFRGNGNFSDAPESERIPFDKLKQPLPILFFDEVPLYEDELGDNGLVTYSAKIRVMPGDLLLLVRLFLKVDDVIFRIRDTRVYVDLENGKVIREYTEREASFAFVKAKVPVTVTDYTQLLRDPNWICSALPLKSYESSIKLLTTPSTSTSTSTT